MDHKHVIYNHNHLTEAPSRGDEILRGTHLPDHHIRISLDAYEANRKVTKDRNTIARILLIPYAGVTRNSRHSPIGVKIRKEGEPCRNQQEQKEGSRDIEDGCML